MYQTKEWAKEILKSMSKETAYFSEVIEFKSMENMLRNEMHFGFVETEVILAALVKAGAKFKIEKGDQEA